MAPHAAASSVSLVEGGARYSVVVNSGFLIKHAIQASKLLSFRTKLECRQCQRSWLHRYISRLRPQTKPKDIQFHDSNIGSDIRRIYAWQCTCWRSHTFELSRPRAKADHTNEILQEQRPGDIYTFSAKVVRGTMEEVLVEHGMVAVNLQTWDTTFVCLCEEGHRELVFVDIRGNQCKSWTCSKCRQEYKFELTYPRGDGQDESKWSDLERESIADSAKRLGRFVDIGCLL